jgi:hypothetical protein
LHFLVSVALELASNVALVNAVNLNVAGELRTLQVCYTARYKGERETEK